MSPSVVKVSQGRPKSHGCVPSNSGVERRTWWIDVRYREWTQTIVLTDPFTPDQQEQLRWYLEDYAEKEPFEATRAEKVFQNLTAYGKELAEQLRINQVIPSGHRLILEIEVGKHASTIHQLHWEVLEDVELWPQDGRPKEVSVTRILSDTPACPNQGISSFANLPTFNVLLVASRPRRFDINHRLISRILVYIIDKLPTTAFPINLQIVRPSTWDAFESHLRRYEPGYFHLIHFDMHGDVRVIDGEERYIPSNTFVDAKRRATLYSNVQSR